MMSFVRDEIIKLFLGRKDKKIVKFFVSPCFACINQTYDSDGGDYSSWSWAICEMAYDYSALEYFQEHKKEFPYCEAPKLCHRKGLFVPTKLISYDGKFDDFDCIGYGIWGSMEGIDYDAPSIGGSVIYFHKRMLGIKL